MAGFDLLKWIYTIICIKRRESLVASQSGHICWSERSLHPTLYQDFNKYYQVFIISGVDLWKYQPKLQNKEYMHCTLQVYSIFVFLIFISGSFLKILVLEQKENAVRCMEWLTIKIVAQCNPISLHCILIFSFWRTRSYLQST